jgi:hypothetical protein
MSEPTGLLFIPQIIYEYGEPWWNDTGRGKTEELGEKPTPGQSVHHKSHMD